MEADAMAMKETPFMPRERKAGPQRTSISTVSQLPSEPIPESTTALLRELVSILRENRTQLREEWARRITESRLLTAMTREEIFAEATTVYDN
jgi:rsbT co-antagonist protein RsbR